MSSLHAADNILLMFSAFPPLEEGRTAGVEMEWMQEADFQSVAALTLIHKRRLWKRRTGAGFNGA